MRTDAIRDFDGDATCDHDWHPLMFGERECLKCGRVEL